jgi:hypothetical protein
MEKGVTFETIVDNPWLRASFRATQPSAQTLPALGCGARTLLHG